MSEQGALDDDFDALDLVVKCDDLERRILAKQDSICGCGTGGRPAGRELGETEPEPSHIWTRSEVA
jgi:hypothetical protein